jgi:hypothetical protein
MTTYVEYLRKEGLPDDDVEAFAQCINESIDCNIPELLAGLGARRPLFVTALKHLADFTENAELASDVEKFEEGGG